jgi:hypothetical protein
MLSAPFLCPQQAAGPVAYIKPNWIRYPSGLVEPPLFAAPWRKGIAELLWPLPVGYLHSARPSQATMLL